MADGDLEPSVPEGHSLGDEASTFDRQPFPALAQEPDEHPATTDIPPVATAEFQSSIPRATASSWQPRLDPPPLAKQRRRWPWVVSVGLLVAALGAVGWYAWDTTETANSWRDSALTWEDRTEEATTRADDTAEQLEESEADVADLESRIDELAAEKAAVADERETAESERDLFAGISVLAADAATQLESCVDEQAFFYDILLDASTYSDWDWIGDLAAEADRICNGALGTANELRDAIFAAGL